MDATERYETTATTRPGWVPEPARGLEQPVDALAEYVMGVHRRVRRTLHAAIGTPAAEWTWSRPS